MRQGGENRKSIASLARGYSEKVHTGTGKPRSYLEPNSQSLQKRGEGVGKFESSKGEKSVFAFFHAKNMLPSLNRGGYRKKFALEHTLNPQRKKSHTQLVATFHFRMQPKTKANHKPQPKPQTPRRSSAKQPIYNYN